MRKGLTSPGKSNFELQLVVGMHTVGEPLVWVTPVVGALYAVG